MRREDPESSKQDPKFTANTCSLPCRLFLIPILGSLFFFLLLFVFVLCLVSSWFVGFLVWVWGLGGPTQRLGFRIWEAGFLHNGLQSLVVNLGS